MIFLNKMIQSNLISEKSNDILSHTEVVMILLYSF
jgi:hypothetical protein